MKDASDWTSLTRAKCARGLAWLDRSSRVGSAIRWAVFLQGLVLWMLVQTAFVHDIVWNRPMVPELDDSLTYVLKTRQMEECFSQDCPALRDLREQFAHPTADPQVHAARSLCGSRIFPVYHPLFSALLLGLTKFGVSLMQVFKIVWTAGPVLFGIAFAYLLFVLWDAPAAGLALGMLAFKVFPDTGLHHVVPSNVATAIAVIIWARLLQKNGHAPFTLIAGCIILIGLHAIGIIYAMMSSALALVLQAGRLNIRTLAIVCGAILLAGLALVAPAMVDHPGFVRFSILPPGDQPFQAMAIAARDSLLAVIIECWRLREGLFGIIPLFFGAVAMGFLTADRSRAYAVLTFVAVYAIFLGGLMFYPSSHPADVILRMWIPLVVVLFGAVGQAFWHTLRGSWSCLVDGVTDAAPHQPQGMERRWIVVAMAVLVGYCVHMMTAGAEQILITAKQEHRDQPLRIEASQPERLLREAGPGDRVLYTSVIVMPYYFIHGAMRLGAMFYDPAMADEDYIQRMLQEPKLRFAVTYNPTVHHPGFDGLPETQWWLSQPPMHFSTLNAARTDLPIAEEGVIPTEKFAWMDVRPKQSPFPRTMSLLTHGGDQEARIRVLALGADGTVLPGPGAGGTIPAHVSARVQIPLPEQANLSGARIVFPSRARSFAIRGLVFGAEQRLHWPWAQRARLSFAYREGRCEPAPVSFDVADLMPRELAARGVRVLDDRGSTVLFRIGEGR
jgi:hypothetical protein